ncbi:hypothetical protein JCM18918_3535 [Cutibacterium acnes JCM 18918]|nr:hypothetical protein JCM18918_3535 [Cutibacterium acnes JCM 18918]
MFSSQLAAGAKKVPTYSQNDRTKLADVVSAPVNGDGPAIATSVAVVAVLLVLGAWIAALATWLVARTVPRGHSPPHAQPWGYWPGQCRLGQW